MLKFSIIASVLAMLLTTTQGQYVKNYKRAADKFYASGDYYTAAKYYEKYLAGKKPGDGSHEPYQVQKRKEGSTKTSPTSEVLYKLAESYRRLPDYTHAETWYKLLLDLDTTTYPNAVYNYAICLRANEQYAQAQQQLEKFMQSKATADYKAKATLELANCKFIQQQLQQPTAALTVARLNGNVNKEGASYAATWMNSNTLVFTATWPNAGKNSTPEYNNALYTSAQQNSVFGEAQKLTITGLKKRQHGVATFTPDGKKMFFTGWQTQGSGKKSAAIYSSEQTANGWSKAVLVRGGINSGGYESRQPQVTPDGKYLLFSSNRKGSMGGFDIWCAALDKNGQPGKAINMGVSINTKEDDAAPFYYAPEQTLVFASKGRTGMGGFDLFKAIGTPGGAWSEAVNMGYPVNSVKNDIYFVNRGNQLLEDAIISSDRASLCCLELFSLHKSYRQYISGRIVDCDEKTPISDVLVTATNRAGQPIAQQTTDEKGFYTLDAEAGLTIQVSATKNSYKKASQPLAAGKEDTIKAEIFCITKIPDPFKGKATLVTHDINFAYNQTDITTASFAYLNDMAEYLKANPDIKMEIDAHTDGVGSAEFNLKLSQARADACVKYLVQAGADPSTLVAKGYGESKPLVKETTAKGKDIPAAREKNRRVEFKILK